MEYENKHPASRGVANTGLGLAIGALGLTALNGGLGNILGGVPNGYCGCSDDHFVNRYELHMQQELAAKDSRISLLESNIYVDSKIADVYERLNGKIAVLEGQIGQQAVVNAQIGANIACMQGNIATLMGLTKTIIPITNICPEPAVATPTTGT